MPTLDRKRPGLAPPARALAASLARVAAVATWRTLHPAAREGYTEAAELPPLHRLYYEAPDGWRASLLHLPPTPGGAGEPVVLAHTLGFGADAFRYGTGPTLAGRLAEAGFAVYLLTHRGDREAIGPDVPTDWTFDDIVEKDLPAALDRVREHSGYPRVHFVGHGLGGQVGLAWAGRGGEGFATLVALCAAVRFDRVRSEMLSASVVASLLPAHWTLPARRLGALLAPWLGDTQVLDHTAGAIAPDRLRGVLNEVLEDIPVGLLRQAGLWLRVGSLVDHTGLFDYREALATARVPLLVAAAGGDRICPKGRALAATERWGGPWDALVLPDSFGHLDALLAEEADKRLFRPMAIWLAEHRRLAWERDGEPIVPRQTG